MLSLNLRVNVLASEAYLQSDPLFRDLIGVVSPFMNVMIDSGAFTNYTIRRQKATGRKPALNPVNLGDYVRSCLDHYHGKVFQYIALDVIRNESETERNLKTMLDAGLKPMPVFIEGFPPSKIDELLKINEFLCVAGGVGSGDHYIRKRFIDIFQDSKERAKIHALGFYRYPDIFWVPIRTSDSSSWCAGSQYGHLKIFHGKQGLPSVRWQQLFRKKLKPEVHERFIRHLMINCRVTKEAMFDRDNYRGRFGIPAMVSTFAYLQAAEFGKGRNFDYFLAVVDSEWLTVILSVLHTITQDGFDYHESRRIFFTLRELRKQKKKDQWLKLCHQMAEGFEGWKNEKPLT